MDDLRIPPSVSFHFEQVVALAGDHAKLDPTEWAIRSRELMGQLEYRWREGIESGLSTEEAQQRALDLFGEPAEVGKRFQKKWESNLLFSNGWRLFRIIVFLLVASQMESRIQIGAAKAKTNASTYSVTLHLKQQMEDLKALHEDVKMQRKTPSNPGKDSSNKQKRETKQAYSSSNGDNFWLFLEKHAKLISNITWLAVISPFLITWISVRFKTSRFGHPISLLLMVPVVLSVILVVGVSAYYDVYSRDISVLYLSFCVFGCICLLADTFDLPAKRKQRLLRMLGYPAK